MEFQRLIQQMRANAGRIAALAGSVSLEQARWKPRPPGSAPAVITASTPAGWAISR